ncbi:MAG: 1-acyl-sn-glycerol-3-phosphate acyltransferase [Lachnospiraceae bacterium]|nr:1-acyl-sn-glycerol-3-phosphate acyltransferase [Lachnospiraceae bacterium]
MRTIIIFIYLFFFFLIGLPYMGIEFLLGKINKKASDLRQLRYVQLAFKIILAIGGIQVTVKGEEKIPDDTAVLYVGNHRGIFDIVISYSRCKNLTGYISKDNIAHIPLLNNWMLRLHCLFLNRDDIRAGLKTILEGIDQMKNGISMAIYPEGTRSRGDDIKEMLPFHEGSMKLATKSGCPIVPMAITETRDIFEDHLPWIHPKKVTLIYGDPIYPETLDNETKKKLGSYCRDQIIKMLEVEGF